MGWFSDLVGDPIGFITGSFLGGGPVGGIIGGQLGNNLSVGGQSLRLDNRPQFAARKKNLSNSLITDKEIDDITRDELLKQLTAADDFGYTNNANILDSVESIFAESKTSQDSKYINRRSVSNFKREKKDRPGLAAQTMLTQNIQGTSTPGMPMKGGFADGGRTLLT